MSLAEIGRQCRQAGKLSTERRRGRRADEDRKKSCMIAYLVSFANPAKNEPTSDVGGDLSSN